jgi:diguanylate cyclase (GGDEF)-like protein
MSGADFILAMNVVVAAATGLLLVVLVLRQMRGSRSAGPERDQLSMLLTERGFEDKAAALLVTAAGTGVPVALVVADLDHFNMLNQSFGRATGDKVIGSFARLITETAPPGAVAARAGERFMIFLPGSNAIAARLLAEALRLGLSLLPVEGVRDGTRFSASLGVAESDGSEDLADFRRRAEAALHAAKQGGRDRVSVAADPGLDRMPSHPLAADPPVRKSGGPRFH